MKLKPIVKNSVAKNLDHSLFMDKTLLIDRIKDLTSPIFPKSFKHDTQLSKLTDIKCVSLDFYGTMFISGVGDIGVDEEQKSASKRYIREALEQVGFSPAKKDAAGQKALEQFKRALEQQIAQKRSTEGIEFPEPTIISVWQDVLKALAQMNIIEGKITEEVSIRVAVEFEFRANNIWPVPELDAILKDLLTHDCKLGIISNSQFYTPLAFEALMGETTDAFGFDPDLQKWSYENGVKKPSLQFYSRFTDELPAKNLAPENVLYIGNDLFKDIIPAKKLGMKTGLYVGDRRSVRHEKEDLEPPKNKPDIIINDLHQIASCLA